MTQPPEFPEGNEPTQPLDPPHPYGSTPPPPPAWGAASYPPQPPAAPGHGYAPPPAPNGMYQAAAIINWVVLGLIVVGTCGLGIIAAAWFIPMTINIHKGAKDQQKHTALAVCTLIFCNIVSGILMLVEDNNRPDRPTY